MLSDDLIQDRSIWREASELCRIDLDNIEDVYPTTPLQEALMSHANELAYNNCGAVCLEEWIEGNRLTEVIKSLVAQSPNLRTRIVDCAAGSMQVVLKEEKQHNHLHRTVQPSTISLENLLAQEKVIPMGLGTPLFRTVIWGQKLVMTIHHAISDHRTIATLLGDIARLYKGEQLAERANYRLFVEYCRSIDEESARAFWASRFTDGVSVFPQVKSGYMAAATQTAQRVISLPESNDTSLNVAILIEIAWAMTSALYAQADKVAFGFIHSGRTRHLGPAEHVLGPTISSVPVQVDLDPHSTIRDQFKGRLRQRQEVMNDPALHWGLAKIGTVSNAAAVASRFTTLINISSPHDTLSVGQGIGDSYEHDRHGHYALSLVFTPGAGNVAIDAVFDSEVIHEQQMDRVLRQFGHYLCALILARPGDRLDSISPISKYDHAEMLDWNQELPAAPHWCIHELFAQRVKRQPGHEAVEAADGSLTYEMLNTLSDQVARDLQRRGLGHEESVALVFEKSTWAVLAMLSVLKAGGVCVPIEPAYPPAQQEAVVKHSKAKMLLTSPTYAPLMQDLSSAIIVLDARYVSQLPAVDDYGLDRGGSPDQAAFVLFTSGSTGKPKGVVLEHRNLATVFKGFVQRLGWRPGSRTLQFASFVWGVSMVEILGTLVAGGVVCMPSPEGRNGDLEGFINAARVDIAILTPTVIRMLSPENVPTLKTLVSGGEAIDPESIRIWSDRCQLFNGWGQSETAVAATLGRIVPGSPFASSIGRPLNCAVWIADQDDVSKLAPIGVLGELVVEGASVARGYLDDEQRSADAFIRPPSWAPRRGHAASATSRMYRTGDLGMFYPDGNICYMGRRDNQAKIHGQKLDLGEVENALNMCEGVGNSFVTVHHTEDGQKLLVAVVSLRDSRLPMGKRLKEYAGHEAGVAQGNIVEIRRQMSGKLPAYMIPTMFLTVEGLPRTVSSKIDRRSIKQWLDEQTLSRARISNNTNLTHHKSVTSPASPIEKVLQAAWAKALSLPESDIGRESCFIRIGGDSMLGMQVAGHCRRLGVQVTVASLLRSATLAETAEKSCMVHQTPANPSSVQDVDSVEFPLSPYQQYLYQHTSQANPAGKHTMTRSYGFEENVDPFTVEQALNRLVGHHPMLRARVVTRADGTLVQQIPSMPDKPLQLVIDAKRVDRSAKEIQKQDSFSASLEDPIFSAVLHLAQGKQTTTELILTSERGVVDDESWDIIREDLASLITQPTRVLSSTASFAEWGRQQPATKTMEPAKDMIPTSISLLPQESTAETSFLMEHEWSLDVSTSNTIMTTCNHAFNTLPIHLMMTALILSFWDIFPESNGPCFYLEEDGRKDTDGKSDFTRTVGCFTTAMPVSPQITPGMGLAEAVLIVKDQCLATAMGSEATSSSYHPHINHSRPSGIEIAFQYREKSTRMSPAHTSLLKARDSHLRGRASLINVSAELHAEQLSFRFSYSRHLSQRDRLEAWVHSSEAKMRAMAAVLPHAEPALSSGDMPLLDPGQGAVEGIRNFLSNQGLDPANVETILPCSPLQEGILMAQLRSPGQAYWDKVTLELTPGAAGTSVDMARLSAAWNAVCQAQPILRTIFTDAAASSNSRFQQIILKSSEPRLKLISDESQIGNHGLNATDTNDSRPQHCVYLYPSANEAVRFTFHFNHALLEARSIYILFNQLGQAYSDVARLRRGPNLSAYIQWTRNAIKAAQPYWNSFLAGVRPSLVPTLSPAEQQMLKAGYVKQSSHEVPLEDIQSIQKLCRTLGITLSNLFQVAWGIVLHHILKEPSVIFGSVLSQAGSVELGDVTLGPLITMIVCRVNALSGRPLSSMLSMAKEDANQATENPICDLGTIHDALGLGRSSLFNTSMTIVRQPEGELGGDADILKMVPVPMEENPTEYAINVAVVYSNESIQSTIWRDGDKVSSSFASRTADMLARAIGKMVTDPDQTVATISDSLGEPPASFSAREVSPDIYRKAASQCECSPSMLEEIYPCTGLQRQQMILSVQGKILFGGMDQFVYTFDQKESSERLRAAVEGAVKAVPALRTRIVSLSGCGACQTTTRSAPYWAEAESLDDHLLFDQSLPVRYGGPLARFGLVEEEDGNRYLAISLHRTIYDDRTLEVVVQAIETLYHGGSVPKVQSFRHFTQLLPQTNPMDQATRWESILSRCTKSLPLPPKVDSLPGTTGPRARTLQFDVSAVTHGPLEGHLLHAAWALCLAKWTGGRQICYGVSSAGLLGSGINALSISGPLGVLLPLSADVKKETSAELFERSFRAEQDTLASVMHTAVPDDGNSATPRHHETESLFDNVLVCRSEPETEEPNPVPSKVLQHLPAMGTRNQPSPAARLVALCTLGTHNVHLELKAHDTLGGDEDVDLMLHQFKHAIIQVCQHPSTPLLQLEQLSEYEISMISRWHQRPLAPVTTPVHTRISQAARTQWPKAPALWSWDAELDYSQLDDLSDRVAAFLQSQGVKHGAVVAYFLEKCAAAVVAQLGILKAGGCLLAMDASHPRDRVLSMVKETDARCILYSPCYLEQLLYIEDIDMHRFDLETLYKLRPSSSLVPEIQIEDPCYIMYTSGSTGTPKGIVVTHASLAAGVTYQNDAIGLTTTSRCLQFSSFVFDAPLIDAFSTFVSGACLCMPSEAERINDIHGVIRRSRCDYMLLTPALAQALEPSEAASLRVLALGGEAVPKGVVQKWRHVRLLNYYGPSENAMITSCSDISSGSGRSHLNIGAGLGCRFWVVDPTCHDRLVSPGSPGELLLQGPTVARGYLNRPELTKAAFIEPPAWVHQFKSLSMSHRWYKTGDIVIQHADGTATYVGRKDGQVKLRGQRIELGEIEYHLQNSAEPGWSTAVEVIRPSGQNQEPMLCAFYAVREVAGVRASSHKDAKDHGRGLLPPLAEHVSKLKLALSELLPPYMQPDMFVRLHALPFTSSGKLDRKALRHLGSTLSSADWSASRAPFTPERNDTTQEMETSSSIAMDSTTTDERKLMQVWSSVLGIDAETIDTADDFFSKGGNSIRAMRLVEGARKLGVTLTVAGVFKSPTLSAMASLAANSEFAGQNTSMMKQGALPKTNGIVAQVPVEKLRERYPFLANMVVESVLPATDLQAYLVAVGELDHQGFHNEMVIECKEGLDAQRLAEACRQLISRHSLFRTVFVQYEAALYQVTVESPPVQQLHFDGKASEEPTTTNNEGPMAFWKHLPRFHFFSMSRDGTRCHKLRLDIHHTFYDAMTIGILVHDLSAAYKDQYGSLLLEGPKYSDWLSLIGGLDLSPSLEFWRHRLRHSSMTHLAPPRGIPGDHPLVDEKAFQVPVGSVPTASLSSAVHAAWAVVLSCLTRSRDVVFATSSANRNLHFPGIDRVAGNCLNFIPVRVRLDTPPGSGAGAHMPSLETLIEQVQGDTAAAVPHHHVDFRRIIQQCTDWPARTRFGSILTYQIHESTDDAVVIGDSACSFEGVGRAGDSADVWVIINPSPSPAGTVLGIKLMYSRGVISDRKAEWIANCYTSVFESIGSGSIEQPLYEEEGKAMLEEVRDGLGGTPKGNLTTADHQMIPVVAKAWREVGLRVTDLDASLFNEADLVTALLLSCSFENLGYPLTLKEVTRHSTIAAQARLLGARNQS